MKAILADLKDANLQRSVAQTMVLVRARDWVSGAMVDEMSQGFEHCLDLVVALGGLGERDAGASAKLEKVFVGEIKDGNGLALTHGLVLANIDPKKREAVLRRLLTNLDQIGDCRHGWLILTGLSNAYALVPPISKDLVKLVEDPDPKVSRGSLWLLESAGLSVRGIAPAIIRFMRGKGDDDRRADAAYALSLIADYSQLAELEKALKEESSPKVRKNLKATINYIRSFESVTWYGSPEW